GGAPGPGWRSGASGAAGSWRRYFGTNPARRRGGRKGSEAEARDGRRRKPEKLKIGRCEVNRSDLEGLQRAWREKGLVLFLCGGPSQPDGLPPWKDLVLEILFDQTDVARGLEPVDLPFRRA